ncbi:JAB domain-containing protein [Neorickettsia sennetsu]|uniref:DNA repair protein RadC n=1 Tax=Ehrlichia sennetsu (strain ATCC VR-367 / Miyayama) TaxID=222891 RepID=Q2GEH3_EHRS3|nr:DNA repair protein RadC [Neorickettsia sennetsu]ABD45823.1 DNA repair protein RadC [Neorickettsia sennetsu str. Miyayama]
MKKLRQEDVQIEPGSLHKGHRLRLRQRIIQDTAGTISELELLEYLLFGTHPRIDIKPLAKSLLKEFGDFKKLFAADPDDLRSVNGVSDAVVALIRTVRESMKAILRKDLTSRTTLKSWKSVVDYLRLSIGNKPVETIRVLFLNKKYTLIREYVQELGAADHTPLCMREIIKKCLTCGASAMVIAHNHPSGNPLPSQEDLLITGKLKKICQKVDVQLVDHFIVTPHDHFSFVVNGLL